MVSLEHLKQSSTVGRTRLMNVAEWWAKKPKIKNTPHDSLCKSRCMFDSYWSFMCK